MSTTLGMTPNDYISQIVRTYPELHIIDDMTWRESVA
jgi:hypothetical protein